MPGTVASRRVRRIGARRAVIATFTPASVTGLAGWWKADAITGLADSDPVASWTDSSGNGKTATQANAGLRPTYKTAIANGRPVVRFDASDDGLVTALALNAAPFTIFLVGNYTGGAPGSHRSINGSNNWLIGPYNGAWSCYAGGWVASSAGASPATADATFKVCAYINSGVSAFYVDGTDKTDSNVVGATPGNVNIGAQGGVVESLAGDVAEVIVYTAALSTTNRQAVEAYLKSKWGTP